MCCEALDFHVLGLCQWKKQLQAAEIHNLNLALRWKHAHRSLSWMSTQQQGTPRTLHSFVSKSFRHFTLQSRVSVLRIDDQALEMERQGLCERLI